ncbi:MAG: hypothetical protein KDD42_07850 [Bdellovibrionales bacterium]|nr:hypothetical protein [Bdellovibrionales bacterium]
MITYECEHILPAFRALEKGKVRYVAVGGIAVVLHGLPRITGDIDLVIELSRDNAEAAIQVLVDLGFNPKVPVPAIQFADNALSKQWIEEKGMRISPCIRRSRIIWI